MDPPTEGSNLIPGDILWSDPSNDSGLGLNKERGIGLWWGPDCTAKFLQDNDLKLIIRGKEAPDERAIRDGLASMSEGYAKDHEGLITLFSAPDHPQFQDTEERHNNKGAYIILQIPEYEEPKIEVFEAVTPRPKAAAYYDYRSLIHSPRNLVDSINNSLDSPSLAPDDKDLISSENVEYKSMDLSEMEVDEKNDVDSKSESRTDEVTASDTLASADKDMVGSSEKTETGSKEANHSETAEIDKDLSDGTQTCDLHGLDSGKSIESRTENNADIEAMPVDEIAAESETRIGEENDVEGSKGRKSNSLEVSINVSEEEDRDPAVELEITYDEKPESAVTEIIGNGTAEYTTDRNRDIATEMLECSTSKLNDSEPSDDMDDSLGTVNADCTSLSKCLTSKPDESEPVVDNESLQLLRNLHMIRIMRSLQISERG